MDREVYNLTAELHRRYPELDFSLGGNLDKMQSDKSYELSIYAESFDGGKNAFVDDMIEWSQKNPKPVIKNGWHNPMQEMPTESHYDEGYVMFIRKSGTTIEEAVWGTRDAFWLEGSWNDFHSTKSRVLYTDVKCWKWIPFEDGNYESEDDL